MSEHTGGEHPALTVIVPVLNEAGNIMPLITEIRAALDGVLGYEILYVDDGSTDATAAELAAALPLHPMLRVLTHDRRCGQSTAMRNGVRAARGRWVAFLDGDGQNDPADLPRLWLRLLEDGADDHLVVAGWRQVYRSTATRRIGSRIANKVRRALLEDGTPDTGCTLKLFSRTLFLDLPYFDHMHRFLGALAMRHGGRVVTVPVTHRLRTRGVSKYGMWDRLLVGIVDLAGMRWLMKRTRLPHAIADSLTGPR
jgi:dolichol-phosphate mannosyltransferase